MKALPKKSRSLTITIDGAEKQKENQMSKKLAPIHPGEILREEYLKPLNLTPYSVAAAIDVPRTRIERLAREETPVTADTALRLGKYFKTTAEFWMNMQAQFDLEMAEDRLAPQIKKISAYKAA
jgi:addiction module HigA family antidote